MKKILINSFLVLFLFGCNPYKRIAGDQNRKPFERQIVLQEAAREVGYSAPPQAPPPTFDSTGFKNHIAGLQEALDISQKEYDNITGLADSIYKDNVSLNSLKDLYKKKIDELTLSIKAIKNAPPVIKEIPKPYKDTSDLIALRLCETKAASILRASDAKDRQIDEANAGKEKALEDKSAAEKFKWMFYGLLALIAIGLVVLFRFKIL